MSVFRCCASPVIELNGFKANMVSLQDNIDGVRVYTHHKGEDTIWYS